MKLNVVTKLHLRLKKKKASFLDSNFSIFKNNFYFLAWNFPVLKYPQRKKNIYIKRKVKRKLKQQ